jgi:hypothetical protein
VIDGLVASISLLLTEMLMPLMGGSPESLCLRRRRADAERTHGIANIGNLKVNGNSRCHIVKR